MPQARNPRPGHDPLHPERAQDHHRSRQRRAMPQPNPAPGQDPLATRRAAAPAEAHTANTNPAPERDPLRPAVADR